MKTLLNTEKGEQNRIYKKRRRDVSESKQTNKKKKIQSCCEFELAWGVEMSKNICVEGCNRNCTRGEERYIYKQH